MPDNIGFVFALRGFKRAFLSQSNLQIHAFFGLMAIGWGSFKNKFY